MHYPAISVKFAQRVRIINWCMHKHSMCHVLGVVCCDVMWRNSLSLSFTLSGYGHWYILLFLLWSLFSVTFSSINMGFCLYLAPSASPYTVCVICFLSCLAGFPLSGSVFVVNRFLSVRLSVCPSVGLSPVSASHCLSSVCMSLCSFVWLLDSSCSCHIPTYIIRYHPECMQLHHQDLCTRNHRSTNKIKWVNIRI